MRTPQYFFSQHIDYNYKEIKEHIYNENKEAESTGNKGSSLVVFCNKNQDIFVTPQTTPGKPSDDKVETPEAINEEQANEVSNAKSFEPLETNNKGRIERQAKKSCCNCTVL